MRTVLCVLASTAAVAGCTTTAPQPRSAAAEQHLQQLLAGKSPGAPRTCLPAHRSSANMVIIDDDTVLFRDGGRRIWRTEMRGPCGLLGSGHYTLVSRSFGGQGPCGGDIVQLVDLTSGMTVGSCVWGDFVPYTRTAG